MHTPDGFLHPWMIGIFAVLSSFVVGVCLQRLRGTLSTHQIQLFGVVTAGIFVAQMLNWPLPGGTSAHFVGGAFAAIVLGPRLGVLSVAVVLTVQALVFGDGGILALGANVWNMAIVEVVCGYAIYRALAARNEPVAIVAAGWGSITLAALSAGVQLGLSPAFGYELVTTIIVMAGGHAVLGVGEGVLTLLGIRLLTTVGADERTAGEVSPA